MCIDCGCSAGSSHHHHHHHDDDVKRTIRVEEDLLAKNNRLAGANRQQLQQHDVLALNMVSSPGSGKTTMLECTLRALQQRYRFAVLEGDQQTDNDAQRIAATGVDVHQINTGAGCHLDAHMVGHGMEKFNLSSLDLLFIENVGNLVCPAAFDLGEDHKVALLSVTEGEDKPLKYPHMFRAADVMVLNKMDLLPYVNFDVERCKEYALRVNPDLVILEASCTAPDGLDCWYQWLEGRLQLRPQG
ncbi:MAG: hydrogenase accessory protein HypB [Desulfuromonadales bacterium C00003068]|jgi:hydrogenase nickel incorporation protein HypB|nr:MAG: hydrogenase accessory protein HypB [Desulfuromonadales bacterium C00003068]